MLKTLLGDPPDEINNHLMTDSYQQDLTTATFAYEVRYLPTTDVSPTTRFIFIPHDIHGYPTRFSLGIGLGFTTDRSKAHLWTLREMKEAMSDQHNGSFGRKYIGKWRVVYLN